MKVVRVHGCQIHAADFSASLGALHAYLKAACVANMFVSVCSSVVWMDQIRDPPAL